MKELDQALSQGPVRLFLDDLASSSPSPGGGAAAALVGAMGAGLVSMVCNLTIGRPRYASVDGAMQKIRAEAEALRGVLTDLAEADARAYLGVAAAYRQAKDTDQDRAARTIAIQAALRAASIPPLAAMDACRAILPLSLQVAAHGNPTVVSDAGVAAELAVAGVRASAVNVRANLADLKDAEYVDQTLRRIVTAEEGMADEHNRVSAIVRAKLAPKVVR